MRTQNLVTAAASLLLILWAGTESCLSDPREKLTLTIHPANNSAEYFSSAEPIWLTVMLTNKGHDSVTVFINQSEERGISVEPAPGSKGVARSWSRGKDTDISCRETEIGPGQSVSTEILLNDFVALEGTGTAELRCSMDLCSSDGKRPRLETRFSLVATGPTRNDHIDEIVRALQNQIDSDSIDARRRAAKSLGALRSNVSLELLRKALRDPDELVQLAAVMALSYISTPEADALLEEASASDNESVRVRAKAVLAGYNRPRLQ